jgi:hypothetical protein
MYAKALSSVISFLVLVVALALFEMWQLNQNQEKQR